jgi:hypothetical protein
MACERLAAALERVGEPVTPLRPLRSRAMSDDDAATRDPSAGLTFDLRGLVWGIESEVAQITSLSRRIDQHVRELNVLRGEAAQRLLQLDELVDAADEPSLQAWLVTATAVELPVVTEVFPDRLYTD